MLKRIYQISFLSFYLIPLITIIVKLINKSYQESLLEVWFLGLLLILTAIIFLLPKITRINKKRIVYGVVLLIVFFFGLGAIGFEADYIVVDFSDISWALRTPYIIMFVIDVILLLGILWLSYRHKEQKLNL